MLRNDIVYSCKHGRRTTMVNVANSGAVRLLCPVHIVEEIFEHAPGWTQDEALGLEEFLMVFRRDYLPLLRVVGALPRGLWSPEEERRLAILRDADRDDVPAVELALVTAAVFLSKDAAALEATYGSDLQRADRHDWLGLLQASGDVNETARVLEFGALLVSVVARAALRGSRRVSSSRTALVLAGAAFTTTAMALLTFSPERRVAISATKTATAESLLALLEKYLGSRETLRTFAVDPPSWQHVEATITSKGTLTRACLLELANSPTSTLTAAQLARIVPGTLSIPHGDAKIRAILRDYACFAEPTKGRFQLGAPFPD